MLKKIANILAAVTLILGLALIGFALYTLFLKEPAAPTPPPLPPSAPSTNKAAVNNAATQTAPTNKLPAPQ